jgi:hypothetical protein
MAKRILILLISVLWISGLAAQEPAVDSSQRAIPVLPPFSVETEDSTEESQKEAPSKVFAYIDAGLFHSDANRSIQQGYFRQLDFRIGYLIIPKQKGIFGPTIFLEPFSRFTQFSIRQDERDISPDTTTHRSKWLKIYSFAGGIGNRIQFIQPDNPKPGLLLDLHVGMCLPYYSAYGTRDRGTGEVKRIRTVNRNIGANYWFFARARISFGRVAFYSEYRLTEVFDELSPFLNPPKLTFGISLEGDGDE